jgi:hypothetical protein
MSEGVTLNLWYAALGTEFGVVIETDNPERLRQKLYALRKAGERPDARTNLGNNFAD